MPIVPQIGSKALTCPKLNLVKPFVFENYQMCLSRILFEFRPSTPWHINHLHLTHQFTLTLPVFIRGKMRTSKIDCGAKI